MLGITFRWYEKLLLIKLVTPGEQNMTLNVAVWMWVGQV